MSELHFPEILENLLRERGITPDLLNDFLNPDYKKLHDPMLLPDIEKARDRIIKAIKNDEHIVVFSDYDADGIPGAVVLSDFFIRAKYKNVSFYIPHRHDEGFGLNCEAIDICIEKKAKLLISVDCGIADIKEVDYANKKGVEVIITDHHEPMEKLPKAFAIVDPKLKNSKYPFKELCGAALAYKLVQAILSKESFGIKEGMEKWSLDMVGIATLSDMVPLIDENRIFAKYGLDVLRKSLRPGLASLFKKLNINQKYLNEEDIAFMITPRINAASRMGKPEDAFKLLSTQDSIEAEKLAVHLEKINTERKSLVASLVKEAKASLIKRQDIPKVIVIGNPVWRPSLMGLVANSLVEEFERPVFVWGRDGDGIIKGSCRTCRNIDLHMLMTKAEDVFIEYGGHKGAGGFAVTLENVSKLEEKLSSALESMDQTEEEEKESVVQIEISDIGENLWKTVSQFAPFGTGNPKPLFHIKNAEVRSAKNFGKQGNHMEIIFKSTNGKNIKAISFFNTIENVVPALVSGTPISLSANLEKSYFMNRPELRLRIVDIKS